MAIEMLFKFIYIVIVIVLGFYEHVQSKFLCAHGSTYPYIMYTATTIYDDV